MKKILFVILAFSMFSTSKLFSQEDSLMNLLDNEVGTETIYTIATFKSTRIINGQSIERMHKRQLDFRVNHRFGQLNSGGYELWGLDNALINFCFEYGVTNWLQIGVRRGTEQKTYDGSAKLSILRQTDEGRVMPVSVSLFGDVAYNSLKTLKSPTLKHRLAYTSQLLIARKFTERLSLQLSPSFVHRNRVGYKMVEGDTTHYYDKNDIYALGIGGKFKVLRRVCLMAEYFYTSHAIESPKQNKYYNPLSLGVDIETGGHVFQLFVTNSRAMIEKGFIAETTSSWKDSGLYFGFNISRVFAINMFSKKEID